jgi:virulence-associated protein VagC
MQALREFVKVKDHSVSVRLPEGFDFEEVEVIIMPKEASWDFTDVAPLLEEGVSSPISSKSHEEVFAELNARYAD